jgi:hypothetical protein
VLRRLPWRAADVARIGMHYYVKHGSGDQRLTRQCFHTACQERHLLLLFAAIYRIHFLSGKDGGFGRSMTFFRVLVAYGSSINTFGRLLFW